MKNNAIKKLLRINGDILTLSKSKKEIILERSEKLDPNNNDIQQKPLLKNGAKRHLRDDGFEHRTSKETTDTI